MNEKKPLVQEIGNGGRIHLPKEIMKAMGVGPGNQIKFEVQGEWVMIARHQIKDPFAEAANKKKGPGFKDLMAQEEARKKEASKIFDQRVQEKHEIRPEDREDFWR